MEKRKSKSKTAALNSATSNEKTPKSSIQDPTPLELDLFVPWMYTKMQQLQALKSKQTVVVKKIIYQEDYPRKRNNLNTTRNSQASMSPRQSRRTDSCATVVPTQILFTTASINTDENAILLTICYNRAGRVVEIAIQDYPYPIDRKLIETISLCLPFHTLLSKFTCKGRGLDYKVVDEIANMLPFSNLTDICLDDTFVPQGNYYNLLDHASTLKCLSLSKCRINDVVCKKIAERLEHNGPASRNIRVLNLSCNTITDVGAQALGQTLRTNRYIGYLNLCGNRITSKGAGYLLEPLSEFPLTKDEVREKIRILRNHFEGKETVVSAQKCPNNSVTDLFTYKNKSFKINSLASRTNLNSTGRAEKMVEDDIFGASKTIYRNGRWFAIGNFTLCSLNLAYNELDYSCLSMIIDVLSYQNKMAAPVNTGLIRIVIEGNNLPIDCEEYKTIGMHLGAQINGMLPFRKTRKSSARKSLRSTNSIKSMKSSSSVLTQ